MTAKECEVTVRYWDTLNDEQKAWVKWKCNFEERPRPFILRDYKDYIDGLAPTPSKRTEKL